MNRSDYWLRVIMTFVTVFAIGFFFGAVNNGVIPDDAMLLVRAGVAVYFWIIGYARCQDAGIHGLWAIFTPMLIGMIILGCLRTKAKAI